MPRIFIFSLVAIALSPLSAVAATAPYFKAHCYDCHDATDKKGGLDLTTLTADFANAETFARWVKIYDRIESGEMPPKKKPRPHARPRW